MYAYPTTSIKTCMPKPQPLGALSPRKFVFGSNGSNGATGDAPEIVTVDVDCHYQLGALFWIGRERLGETRIFVRVAAARSRSLDGTCA